MPPPFFSLSAAFHPAGAKARRQTGKGLRGNEMHSNWASKPPGRPFAAA